MVSQLALTRIQFGTSVKLSMSWEFRFGLDNFMKIPDLSLISSKISSQAWHFHTMLHVKPDHFSSQVWLHYKGFRSRPNLLIRLTWPLPSFTDIKDFRVLFTRGRQFVSKYLQKAPAKKSESDMFLVWKLFAVFMVWCCTKHAKI